MRRLLNRLLPKSMRSTAVTIPVIRLHGTIMSGGGQFRPSLSLATTAGLIEKAFAYNDAPAVAISINSPGGSPVQSRLIYRRIRDLAAEKNKTVLVFVEDVAASGGYMIAVAGDEIPIAASESVPEMITATVDEMYSEDEPNRFLEVTYANGDKEILYFKDFNSGAMIENIVSRAKKMAIKRFLETGEKGIKAADLFAAVTDEFKENEDLPNTTNPDDWARISGKKGERIVYVRTLIEGGNSKDLGRTIEQVNAGQYL